MAADQIHVVVLDMDDTLLRSDGTLSARTEESLQRWRDQGGEVVIATGRPPRAVAGSLPASLHDAPFICYNGADARQGDRVLHADLIPTADVQSVLVAAERVSEEYTVGLEVDDRLYLNRPPDRFKNFVLMDDLLEAANQPAAKILFVPVSKTVDIQQDTLLLETVVADLPMSIRPMHSTRYRLLQLMSHTADKVEALQVVLEGMGYGLENAIAFGDDVNDVGMVARSGIGVAVANAVPEVHAVADRITRSNDEDGVAMVIEELLAARTQRAAPAGE